VICKLLTNDVRRDQGTDFHELSLILTRISVGSCLHDVNPRQPTLSCVIADRPAKVRVVPAIISGFVPGANPLKASGVTGEP